MSSSPLFRWLYGLSPDQAVILASTGLVLIFVELNRPGRIFAGSFGLLFLLFAVADLLRLPLRPGFAAGVLAITCVFLLNLYRELPAWLLGLAAICAVFALRFLVRPVGDSFVHTLTALLCGGVLGLASAALTRIAFRARRAKALN